MQQLTLPAELDITGEAFAQDARTIACADELEVCGSEVRRVDAAGLQLLYAVVTAARVRGARVRWNAPSQILLDAARAAGLDRLLDV